jgi:DNA-binding CsgD family transcriptional regulator
MQSGKTNKINKIMKYTVWKLLEFGMTRSQVARELKITESQVKAYAEEMP